VNIVLRGSASISRTEFRSILHSLRAYKYVVLRALSPPARYSKVIAFSRRHEKLSSRVSTLKNRNSKIILLQKAFFFSQWKTYFGEHFADMDAKVELNMEAYLRKNDLRKKEP